MEYGQFCPVAKATEIIGEKWTLLIIRELLMGGSRFNELHRGLSLISPTILSRRLDTLSEHGLVVKKKIPGQRGYEYFPTDSCQELLPIIRNDLDFTNLERTRDEHRFITNCHLRRHHRNGRDLDFRPSRLIFQQNRRPCTAGEEKDTPHNRSSPYRAQASCP